mgnify:CR=1 FL=1
MLNVSIIKCLSDNYSYLLKDETTNIVGIVDPSEFTAVDKEIEKKYKKLDFIFNTHHHDDHVGGNLELKEKYNSKIVCSFHDKIFLLFFRYVVGDLDEIFFCYLILCLISTYLLMAFLLYIVL